ncbi:MAG TPA: hypothetical protein VFR68_11035 [Candidatus Dormibacteraeota bacterium]|nr:hypothetical protein [Candidatus Dormibacteraeota bacterium]
MAVEQDSEPGAGPALVIIAVVVFIVVLVIVFWGLAGLHWFGFNTPASVGTAPSVTPTPTASASAAASASASP